jgi:hypothetical protein
MTQMAGTQIGGMQMGAGVMALCILWSVLVAEPDIADCDADSCGTIERSLADSAAERTFAPTVLTSIAPVYRTSADGTPRYPKPPPFSRTCLESAGEHFVRNDPFHHDLSLVAKSLRAAHPNKDRWPPPR